MGQDVLHNVGVTALAQKMSFVIAKDNVVVGLALADRNVIGVSQDIGDCHVLGPDILAVYVSCLIIYILFTPFFPRAHSP